MKRLILLTLFFCTAQVAVGEVSTRVCRADGNTPLEYQEIMVGTELTIIVSSDANADSYPVDLFIEGPNRDYGLLSDACCLDAAGEGALVYPWDDDFYQGFCFQTGEIAEANDWFIADYNATNIGDCSVAFYDNFMFAYNIPFTHVPTRDFDGSTRVDFGDFTVLASYWQETDCNECGGADLDDGNNVDVNDLMLFTDYWLETTK